MKKIIGNCSHCGGPVSVPIHYMSVNPPIPECDSCGAQADNTAHLPTIPMKPRTFAVEHVQRETRTDDPLKLSMSRWPGGRTVLR